MPGTSPIQLGSAIGTGWTFESGSGTSTDQYGIQTAAIKALFPQGDSVFSSIPAAGVSFSTVFGNSYLPASFLLDFFDGAPSVDYQDARVARIVFKFKRIDPLFANRRTVSVDSVLNYKSVLTPYFDYQIAASGQPQDGIFGFPEPVCSVKYSATSQPSIGAGGLSQIYALPGSNNAIGFPPVPLISVPLSRTFGPGTVMTYYNGTAFVTVTLTVPTTFSWNIDFGPNVRGWQLIKLKSDPVANNNFWAVEETWRNFYVFLGVSLISVVPPLPP